MTELSRPTLAILNEDYPKVKSIESKQEINALINFLITVLNIKISNDDEKIHLDKQMILILDLIKTKFGSLTIPEIQEAFKMFVAREFPEIKVFRVLDCVVVGEVLNAFKEFRNESLRTYDQKKLIAKSNSKPTDKVKEKIREEFLKIIFDELIADSYSYDSWILFSELEESGKLIIDSSEKKILYEVELQKYIPQKANEIYTNNTASTIYKRVKKDFQKDLDSKKPIVAVVNKCKSILVSRYLLPFKNFHEFKKVIEL